MEITVQPTMEDYLELSLVVAFSTTKKRRRHSYLRLCLQIVFFIATGAFYIFSTSSRLLSLPMQIVRLALLVVCGGMVLWLCAVILNRYFSRKRYKNSAKKLQGIVSNVWITEEGLTTATVDGLKKDFRAWAVVDSLVVSKNLYVFIVEDDIVIFFNKKALHGQDAWLMQMVSYSMPGKPVMQF